MVHPNLLLTKCDMSSVTQIQRYQLRLQNNATSANRELIAAEIRYLKSYSNIMDIMHKYFSAPELTPEDECTGLDLIAKEMEVFKEAEAKLASLKRSRNLNTISEE